MAPSGEKDSISSAVSKEQFSLLDLPAEIWSKIGKHAIDNEPHFTLETIRQPTDNGRRTYHQPPITRACKVLRAELLPYYYNTKICMSERHLNATALVSGHVTPILHAWSGIEVQPWLKAIGLENARQIRGLAIMSWRCLPPEDVGVGGLWGYKLELSEPVPAMTSRRTEYLVRVSGPWVPERNGSTV